MFTKVDHMAICVKNLEESIEKYERELGLTCTYREVVEDQDVKVAFFTTTNVNIELIQPLTEDNPVYQYILKKGEGLHHVAFRVENIEESIEKLKQRHIPLINHSPKKGILDSKIAFIHPKHFGMLIELVQRGANSNEQL